jgi:hypothetical protein
MARASVPTRNSIGVREGDRAWQLSISESLMPRLAFAISVSPLHAKALETGAGADAVDGDVAGNCSG